METMRALSLWQPWAHFVATEQKSTERRYWKALPASLVGQRIAIHAAHSCMPQALWHPAQFLDAIEKLVGWRPQMPEDVRTLDYGSVLCTARVAAVRWLDPSDFRLTLCDCKPKRRLSPVGIDLADIINLTSPLPVTGGQSIFIIRGAAAAEIIRRSTRPLPFPEACTEKALLDAPRSQSVGRLSGPVVRSIRSARSV